MDHLDAHAAPGAAATAAALWDDEAAAHYDTPGTGMFADDVVGPAVDRLVQLAAGGAALEFAVGTGRIAVPLRRRGVPVTGIEQSPSMIARLREKADEAEIPVVVGDMAAATAPGEFALVLLVYNTIGNLLTQAGQVACFRNAAAHLRPGGCFVIELEVPRLRALPPGSLGVVFAEGPDHLGLDVYDALEQHLVSYHVWPDGGGAAKVFHMPQRYVWPAELDLMGQLAGFTLESRHGDWSGAAFTADSPSHVSVYRLG